MTDKACICGKGLITTFLQDSALITSKPCFLYDIVLSNIFLAARPKVIITFDDGYDNCYSKAYPIMAANGQRGVAFIITNSISALGRMTMLNLRELYADGWDISNHTKSHPNLTTLSDADMQAQIDDADNVLASFRSKKFFAYPNYAWSTTIIDYLKLKKFIFARRDGSIPIQPHITYTGNVPFMMRCYQITNTTSPSLVEENIDLLISGGGLMVLNFHQIVDSGATISTKYLTEYFQMISDYLKVKSDAGLLDVETFTDYHKGFFSIYDGFDANAVCKFNLTQYPAAHYSLHYKQPVFMSKGIYVDTKIANISCLITYKLLD
jgi:hypothetical protein